VVWALDSKRRVVVTGIGPVTSLGIGVRPFWDSLVAGQSGIGLIQSFDASDLPVRIAGEVLDFDPTAWMTAKEARRADRTSQLAVASAVLAWEDAGTPSVEPSRAGTIVSCGPGLLTMLGEYRVMLEQGWRKIAPLSIPMLMPNAPVANVGIKLGFTGPNLDVLTACAASANAIGEAYRYIKEGVADVMVAGGSEAGILLMTVVGFARIRALSQNPEPTGASRPFDAKRDGFVLGEGAVTVVLEEAGRAVSRGAPIYAEVVGYGISSDGYHITAPDPDGVGAVQAMQMCVESTGGPAEAVDYINAHGTSTPLNDAIETKAIKKVFGDHAYGILISSTKSMTGHLLAASGAIEAAACALTVRDGLIPPTVNLDNPDPDCDLDYVPKEARRAQVRLALSNSFAFGGHNAVLAFRHWTE
jgi:3-oxoacyl-[acyl-carrier-protein] synthase II